MEIKVESYGYSHQAPLLETTMSLPKKDQKTLLQKAVGQTFQSTAHLANLLPTGTVLAFQLLSPIFTNQGHCDPISRSMTISLITLCGLSCFFLSFSDSFKDANGTVCYGFATLNGLWVIDGSVNGLTHEEAVKYRLKFIDFLHAFMSLFVFGAVALFDQNVVQCLYPAPSQEVTEVLKDLPVAVGVICSMLFVTFPTRRHGIGFPVTAD